MHEFYKFCRAGLWLVFSALTPSLLFAQAKRTLTAVPSTTIDSWIHGYYISLPANYSTSGKNYPLLIFIHGEGEIGDGSAANLPIVLRGGPPMQINQQVNHNVDAHFPDPVVVGGKSYEFIVMAPQMTQQPGQNGPEQVMIDDVINYAIKHYRVDSSKISITGLSMGGGIAIEYPGQSAKLYGRRLASLLGCAIASYNAPDRAKEIAAAHLPVWLTVNSGDNTGPYGYTIGYMHNLDSLHASPAPIATIFNAAGHYGWLQTYGAPGVVGITDSISKLNVYQWMLQYRRVGDSVVVEQGIPVDTTPLPPITSSVVWGPYNAGPDGKGVTVNWSTVLEQNNKYFIVQRSSDGTTFVNIDTTAAANAPHSYAYVDPSPLTGASYYRLLQVSTDGRTSYSDTMNVTFSGDTQPSLHLKPNPSSGLVYLEMTNADLGKLEVSIADASGRTLRNWSFDKQAAYWSQAINTASLPAGTYFLVVKGPKTRSVRTFLKSQD
jgi:S-formylglutathione hydrolase FrmB